jgi:two-component system, cell cycle sensor histidine kinase and response regulator CckA
MDSLRQPKIEIGHGSAQEKDSFSAGRLAAAKALSMIHASPVVALIVFASVKYDLQEVLRGIGTICPEPPLFGCTTACEICSEPLHESVVVTVLASPYIKVSCGLGRDVSKDWQSAVDDVVTSPAIHAYFDDVTYWQELTLKGTSVFAILFSPGNTRHNTSRSYEILEAIKMKSLGRLPVFGGSTADDWRMETNYVLCDDEAIPDGMLLAVFETQLQFGIAMDHGFVPTPHQTTVTRVRGHEVLELDGCPAADIYARIIGSERAELEGKHLTLTTGHTMGTSDSMGQYSINVASFITATGGINFTQPVSASTELTLLEPDAKNTHDAGNNALRKAIMRGGVNDPALSLVAYCALRPKIFGEKSWEEIHLMAEMLAGSPLVGFCSFGEQGVADDGTIRHNNAVISVLVLGSDLSPNARVALENEKLRQKLEHQAVTLSDTNRDLLAEITERKRIEAILQEAHAELESRVNKRTIELSAANERLRLEIIEKNQAEVKMQQSNVRFKTLADATFEGIAITEQGRFVDFNKHLAQIYGYERSELLGMEVGATLPPEERDRVLANIMSGLESRIEHVILRKDGSHRFVEVHGKSIEQNGRNLRLTAIRDITDRKEMEQALQESEELFRTLCNSAPIGIFRSDGNGSINYVNPHCEKIFQLPAVEILGQGWLRAVHPEDRESKGKIWREAVAARRSCSQEYRLLAPMGQTVLIQTLASPIRDQAGNCLGYVGAVEDITERRQALQDMTRTQKLESLGVLAGGIAHDFNNILTAILGNISLARIQFQDPDKAKQRLTEAENATARAKDLTQQLLTFARGGEPVKKTLKVENLLRETAVFACHGSAAKCDFVLADNLWLVEADEGQIFQVINNLVINAVHAMPDGGIVTIRAENDSSKLAGKRSVKISVSDSGTGIPDDHYQKIFDPYFTTKPNGTGLGLATCFSIIKKHDGIVTFESTVGKGTTFYVYLPALGPGNEVAHDVEMTVEHGCGRILVMDDEKAVTDIARAMLETLGYTVECAKNGADTVELYKKRKEEGNPFSAVIMDLTIPGGMGGKEAVNVLHEIDPTIKAIVSSGYSTDPIMSNFREYGFSAVLRKPYRLQEISLILQNCLKN